jgi:hypothetical protein
VLTLAQSFYGREDHELTGRLLRELPGIMNWAIEGWERLYARGRFVQPASAEEAIEELEDLGSPVGAFLRQRCEVGPGKGVASWAGCSANQSSAGSPATRTSTTPSGLPVIPQMRAIVGREGLERLAASSSQIGRFETEWLASDANLEALMDLPGAWIDRVNERTPPDCIILDINSSESPTYGEQEGSAWKGHFRCTCYHPLFLFNQFGDLECCRLRPGNVHSAEDWRLVLEPVIDRYRERGAICISVPMRRSPSQRFTSCWRQRASATRSGYRPTRCCSGGSATC